MYQIGTIDFIEVNHEYFYGILNLIGKTKDSFNYISSVEITYNHKSQRWMGTVQGDLKYPIEEIVKKEEL